MTGCRINRKTSFWALLKCIFSIRLLEVGYSTITVGSTFPVVAQMKGGERTKFLLWLLIFPQARNHLPSDFCYIPSLTSECRFCKFPTQTEEHALSRNPSVAIRTSETQSLIARATNCSVLELLMRDSHC